MSWITPIIDRTLADVTRAEALSRRINQNGFSSLTTQEQTEWLNGLKGALNATDLNRIENNIKVIHDKLTEYAYFQAITERAIWTRADLPYASELGRICDNLRAIIGGYHSGATSVPTDVSHPTHETINDIEKVVFEIDELIDRMEQSFIYSGEINSGGYVIYASTPRLDYSHEQLSKKKHEELKKYLYNSGGIL